MLKIDIIYIISPVENQLSFYLSFVYKMLFRLGYNIKYPNWG